MWSLQRPAHTALDTYSTCISRVRSPALRARLQAATLTVVGASATFDDAAGRHALHEIVRQDIVAPDVTTEEMETVYTQRMAKKAAPGRDIYDDIFFSSPGGRCPLCAQRLVTTLDHHLPKASYPALSVTPLNLVPSCTDCNKSKLAAVPQAAENCALHPYYDNLGQERWLVARVVETRPMAVRFLIQRATGWSDVLNARVHNHFRTLGLAALYASEAGEELVNIRHQLIGIHATSGLDGVREELEIRAISSAVSRPNGWRSATYSGWAESDWFCDGGFAHEN
jgi:hypothetical protein